VQTLRLQSCTTLARGGAVNDEMDLPNSRGEVVKELQDVTMEIGKRDRAEAGNIMYCVGRSGYGKDGCVQWAVPCRFPAVSG
jgi:hypothetical protein